MYFSPGFPKREQAEFLTKKYEKESVFMAADSTLKRPLITGQFVWSISKKDGKLKIIVGPDPLEATDDDIFVIPDKENPKKLVPVSHPNEAVQDFVTLKIGEYAVVHSPSESSTPDYPNGNYSSAKNDMKPLKHGQKRVITSGHFLIWPGQSVEIRKLHQLSSSQYLMVVVENADIDPNAPYYDVTMKCAGIKKAVVDETVGSEDNADKIRMTEVKGGEDTGEDQLSEENKPKVDDKKKVVPTESVVPKLRVGQRIIIPGSITPTYIPPTGIEVVVENIQVATEETDTFSPRDVIKRKIYSGILKIEELKDILKKEDFSDSDISEAVDSSYRGYCRNSEKEVALFEAIKGELSSGDQSLLANILQRTAPTANGATAVREAVVLGPTEFCVLFDEDGKPKNHKGPGRVFPGPYDRFRTDGSRNRIYDAYHLRGDRGLLLRVVAESISNDELQKQLPVGSGDQLDKENYVKGDEIFIGGFDAYLVPSNSIEVINPETRLPNIGNDHEGIYVQAIGVDQKSGVYVADVSTGNVKLEKGEKKLLLDPRREKHIKRRIPGRLWNLIIGQGEPHKKTGQQIVDSPWALSVVIPNNEAVMITSKDGRRVVVGPCMELLEYEEWLEVLTFSKGRPKTEDNFLETCYLRVKGNRITDQFIIETSDFVQILIDVSYGVEFVGETQDDKSKWFNYKNYVWLLCNNLRSRLKLAARRETLDDIYSEIPEFVRGTILGHKSEEGKHRPGLKFDENNMLVNEVEVLSIIIPDTEIEQAMNKANRKFVTIQIEDKLKQAEFTSARNNDEVDAQMAKIKTDKAKRDKETSVVIAGQQYEVDKTKENLKHSLGEIVQKNIAALAMIAEQDAGKRADLMRVRTEADKRSSVSLKDEERMKIVEFRKALADIQIDIIDATSQADVDRLQAIEPQLIKAIEGLGNKELATALAENLPKAGGALGFLLGHGGLSALKGMVKGTIFEAGINALNDSETGILNKAENIEKPKDEEE